MSNSVKTVDSLPPTRWYSGTHGLPRTRRGTARRGTPACRWKKSSGNWGPGAIKRSSDRLRRAPIPRHPGLTLSFRHGTAHRIGAQLFAQPVGRQTLLCSHVSVFFEFCPFLRPTGILAGFTVLGFRDAGPCDSLARQHAAAELHPDGANYRFFDPPRNP